VLLTNGLNSGVAKAIRAAMLALVCWSVLSVKHGPGTSGRGIVALVLLVICVVCSVIWVTLFNTERPATLETWLLAGAGGLLTGTANGSAAAAFTFIAVVSAGLRSDVRVSVPIALVGVLGLAISAIIYDYNGLGVLAYSLGFAAALLAATNARQSFVRAEQAELLLAQAQRSQEEELRAARLEESTRIARDIHDVLAHALAGLTIQLEATRALVEQGADQTTVLARVDQAHELAREGLRETRRAVGALRGEMVPVPLALESLVGEFGGAAELTIDADPARLEGRPGETVLRVVQEALTNVRKHAPGADVSVSVSAPWQQELVVVVVDDVNGARPETNGLASVGGGFGLKGMHERAQALGGTITAGASDHGWRVELRLPPPAEGAS
jgi:signal transduction histidine kinase